MSYGAMPVPGDRVQFRVWAPFVERLAAKIEGRPARIVPMTREGEDFEALIPDVRPGDRYRLILNNERERPDPASRSQPEGVHGPSAVVAPDAFDWADHEWRGIDLKQYIIYELHVGAFSSEGTFEGVVTKLAHLKTLGITAIELMPVAEFPGTRNWGYDGVSLYAPHSSYGGAGGLKRLVNACHLAGLAVILDVVYNHLGPEGNYLAEFAPYFTDQYKTPWGTAINFDGPGSDGTRRFFIDNALYWLTEYHIDALRLDAIHSIFDFGAVHILDELTSRFHREAGSLGRRAWIIAESDLNDVRVVRPSSVGGYGFDAQWLDEYHHSLLSYQTGARRGYLSGFGLLEQVGKTITDGFVYDGIYSPYRKRRFGSSSKDEPGDRFVVFLQNHDQVANTFHGHRLTDLVSFEQRKLAAALLLCSPYVPLLFMGEEFDERAPFLYFTSHGDLHLARAVTEGRRKEFADFQLEDEFSDPQAPETFEKSKITWALIDHEHHRDVLRLYRDLIALRKKWSCLSNCSKDLVHVDIDEDARHLTLERSDPSGSRALLLCNFGQDSAAFQVNYVESDWRLALWTASENYGGRPLFDPAPLLLASEAPAEVVVQGHSAVLYTHEPS
jgi:maltooligosyltrehalose trehalohydrolase